MNKSILGKRIVAAIFSPTHENLTRVWCEDGSLHLVTGYQSNGALDPTFEMVVGYWKIPEGCSYLSDKVEEVITRPFIMEMMK